MRRGHTAGPAGHRTRWSACWASRPTGSASRCPPPPTAAARRSTSCGCPSSCCGPASPRRTPRPVPARPGRAATAPRRTRAAGRRRHLVPGAAAGPRRRARRPAGAGRPARDPVVARPRPTSWTGWCWTVPRSPRRRWRPCSGCRRPPRPTRSARRSTPLLLTWQLAGLALGWAAQDQHPNPPRAFAVLADPDVIGAADVVAGPDRRRRPPAARPAGHPAVRLRPPARRTAHRRRRRRQRARRHARPRRCPASTSPAWRAEEAGGTDISADLAAVGLTRSGFRYLRELDPARGHRDRSPRPSGATRSPCSPARTSRRCTRPGGSQEAAVDAVAGPVRARRRRAAW